MRRAESLNIEEEKDAEPQEEPAAAAQSQKISLPQPSVQQLSGTPEPGPKVLDCGPLASDCNTNQRGKYYAKKTSSTGVKGISEDHAMKQAEERRNAKKRAGAHTAFTADDAMMQAEERLHAKKGAEACHSCMQLWTTSSLNCVIDKCPSVPHVNILSSLSAAPQGGVEDAVLQTAMQGLDWRQLQLNNARAALFERFVGPDDSATASQVRNRILPSGRGAWEEWHQKKLHCSFYMPVFHCTLFTHIFLRVSPRGLGAFVFFTDLT